MVQVAESPVEKIEKNLNVITLVYNEAAAHRLIQRPEFAHGVGCAFVMDEGGNLHAVTSVIQDGNTYDPKDGDRAVEVEGYTDVFTLRGRFQNEDRLQSFPGKRRELHLKVQEQRLAMERIEGHRINVMEI